MEKKQQGRNGGTLNVGGTMPGAGRPKKLPALDEIGANLLSEEKGGMNALEAILKGMIAKAVKGDTQAAKLIIERFYGQAKQMIEHSGSISNTPDFSKLSDTELDAYLTLCQKLNGGE